VFEENIRLGHKMAFFKAMRLKCCNGHLSIMAMNELIFSCISDVICLFSDVNWQNNGISKYRNCINFKYFSVNYSRGVENIAYLIQNCFMNEAGCVELYLQFLTLCILHHHIII
jgi:hypothetical protein